MAARSHYGGFEFMPRPSQGYYGKVAEKVVSIPDAPLSLYFLDLAAAAS